MRASCRRCTTCRTSSRGPPCRAAPGRRRRCRLWWGRQLLRFLNAAMVDAGAHLSQRSVPLFVGERPGPAGLVAVGDPGRARGSSGLGPALHFMEAGIWTRGERRRRSETRQRKSGQSGDHRPWGRSETGQSGDPRLRRLGVWCWRLPSGGSVGRPGLAWSVGRPSEWARSRWWLAVPASCRVRAAPEMGCKRTGNRRGVGVFLWTAGCLLQSGRRFMGSHLHGWEPWWAQGPWKCEVEARNILNIRVKAAP